MPQGGCWHHFLFWFDNFSFFFIVFVKEIIHFISHFSTNETELILFILTLIDLSFAGNLLIIVIFSGYENFVSKLNINNHEDKPEWMGTVDFGGLKLKLVSSIVAISGIHLLKLFFGLENYTKEQILLFIAVHFTFVLSLGVLLAYMDFLTEEVSPVNENNPEVKRNKHFIKPKTKYGSHRTFSIWKRNFIGSIYNGSFCLFFIK